MVKKFLIISSLICASAQAMIYLPTGITTAISKDHAKRKKIIIAYDIHDVLARKDKISKFKTVIKHLPTVITSKITAGHMWDEINAVSQHGVSGQAYQQVFKKYGYSSLANMAQEAANAYRPRIGMATIVHQLKLLGYTQRFASNIGDTFLESLNIKFKSKYKNYVLDMIEPGKVADCSQFGSAPLTKPLPKHLATQPKPHATFFQEFIDAWNPKRENLMIFIDDKLENVKAAVTQGFVGIHVNATWDDDTFVKHLRAAYQSLGLYDK